MVKPHGRLNKHALEQMSDSLSGSGILRIQRDGNGSFLIDVNQPVAQLQKNQALIPGAGRLVILKGNRYIPAYTIGIGAAVGSGYTAPSDGMYQVDAIVSVSGVAIETYGGVVLVNNVPASGTASLAVSDARGASAVKIAGVVQAVAGQNINVGVTSLHGNLTTIGSEDLVWAPAATLRVVKLGSDALAFNQ
jgi:hypothetical protein